MKLTKIEKLLEKFKKGEITDQQMIGHIKAAAIQSLEFAQIDHHREIRQGFPEVIFCQGKTAPQVVKIAQNIFDRHGKLLATRVHIDLYNQIKEDLPGLIYNEAARCLHSPFPTDSVAAEGKISIVSAGTSDIPVAEESVVTCRLFGYKPAKIFDVGVAGLHRLNHHWETIQKSKIIVAVAGMEGALASVIGGLIDKPVIAVPTSVGYGTSFGGLTALFAMLNSCSSNVLVVNIDNGFGAGFAASLILKQIVANTS